MAALSNAKFAETSICENSLQGFRNHLILTRPQGAAFLPSSSGTEMPEP